MTRDISPFDTCLIPDGSAFTVDADGMPTLTGENVHIDDLTAGHDENGTPYLDGVPAGWEPVTGMSNQDSYDGPLMEACEHLTPYVMSRRYEDDDVNTFTVAALIHDGDLRTGNVWDVCDCAATTDEDCVCDRHLMNWMLLRKVDTTPVAVAA